MHYLSWPETIALFSMTVAACALVSIMALAL